MTEQKIGVLVKTSLVDYPGKVACTLFLQRCNLRCPYCYNGPLVLHSESAGSLVTLKELFQHLTKRRNVIEGFVISGGEALLNPQLTQIISEAKKLGYKIKLDTNGTNPSLLKKLFDNPETTPDFVAMDLKTDPINYRKLLNARNLSDKTDYETAIKESITIISTLGNENYEIRTVLVPTLVTKENILSMAAFVPLNAKWRFAQFHNENCLEPLYDALKPYSDSEAQEIVKSASSKIKDSKLR